MGVWAAAVGGALSAGGAMASGAQSARANKSLYKHRYQWTVGDLQKAGLNPMLAYQQGAPVPQSPNIPNVGEAAVRGASAASSASAQNKLVRAQLENIQSDTSLKQASAKEAQARSAGQIIGNTIAAEQVPFAAKNALAGWEKGQAEIAEIGTRARNIGVQTLLSEIDLDTKRVTIEQAQKLQQLDIAYKQYVNEAMRLGMSQKEAESKFWNQVGVTGVYVEKGSEVLDSLPSLLKFKGGKTLRGKERSTTKYGDGSTHTQETYDYR